MEKKKQKTREAVELAKGESQRHAEETSDEGN